MWPEENEGVCPAKMGKVVKNRPNRNKNAEISKIDSETTLPQKNAEIDVINEGKNCDTLETDNLLLSPETVPQQEDYEMPQENRTVEDLTDNYGTPQPAQNLLGG